VISTILFVLLTLVVGLLAGIGLADPNGWRRTRPDS